MPSSRSGSTPSPPSASLPGASTCRLAARSESQDLCFLAGQDYRDFIRRNAPGIAHPGPILSRDGKTLGEHQGLAYYTIGQRKGLGVPSSVPLYVLAKDTVTNTLVVGGEAELGGTGLTCQAVNWIAGEAPKEALRLQVKTRYTAREAWARDHAAGWGQGGGSLRRAPAGPYPRPGGGIL